MRAVAAVGGAGAGGVGGGGGGGGGGNGPPAARHGRAADAHVAGADGFRVWCDDEANRCYSGPGRAPARARFRRPCGPAASARRDDVQLDRAAACSQVHRQGGHVVAARRGLLGDLYALVLDRDIAATERAVWVRQDPVPKARRSLSFGAAQGNPRRLDRADHAHSRAVPTVSIPVPPAAGAGELLPVIDTPHLVIDGPATLTSAELPQPATARRRCNLPGGWH